MNVVGSLEVAGRLEIDRRKKQECTNLDELNGLERSLGDQSRSTTGSGTPGDHLTLGISNDAELRRSPKTEIFHRIDERSLASRLGSFSGSVTSVVSGLDSSRSVVGVDFEGEIVVFESTVSERDGLPKRGGGEHGGEYD